MILILSIPSSSAEIDTTLIGIEEGEVYHFKMVSLNDDFEGQTEVCFECPDQGPQLKLSENEEVDLEIVSIGDIVIVKANTSGEEFNMTWSLDERTKTMILYTDWEYWSGSIAEDWSWWANASLYPFDTWPGLEYLESFEVEIIHQIEGEVFNTHLGRKWNYNSSDELKSYESTQHFEYGLETGVVSTMIFNETVHFWNDTIQGYYEETVLQSMTPAATTSTSDDSTTSTKDDSPIPLSWLLVPLTMIAAKKRSRR